MLTSDKRPGQILGQADNGGALDAGGRFDFVAGDHRAGVGRDDLDLDAEVAELAFDQARGEFERLGGRHGFGIVRGFVEQVQWRQRAARRVEEQRLLPFLLDAGLGLGGAGYFDLDRLDLDRRRGAILDLLALDLDGSFALFGDDTPIAAVLPGLPQAEDQSAAALKAGTDALGHVKPGPAEEQADARSSTMPAGSACRR